MKTKILFFLATIFSSGIYYSQYTTGTVNLSTTGMTVKFDTNATTVTMTLTGNSNSMLGIGFGTDGMNSGDDGFIYNSGANRDFAFAGVGVFPTADAAQNWTEVSNTIAGTTRTIVATRSLSGGAGDYAFTNGAGTINIYYARRNGNQAIGNHGGGLRDYATLSTTLGTNDVESAQKIKLYPNPAKEKIQFKNFEKISLVRIFDVNGRLTLETKKITENMNISKLNSGTYFVEYTSSDGEVSYEKLIKK